jgi:hypothetical protein
MPLSLPASAQEWEPPWEADTPQRIPYRDHGYLVLPRLVPHFLMDAYCAAYVRAGVAPAGWPPPTAYRDVPEMRDLLFCDPILETVAHLIGEPPLLHLALTGWVSTERDWHQDVYLNPPETGDSYCAVWVALEDIHPDSGPFEYIPSSHRWPVLTREALFATLSPEQQLDPDWPRFTEAEVAPMWEREIAQRGGETEQFIAQRGDVLFWHPRLLHRGSVPRDVGRERRALIAHWSGVHHRPDMSARTAQGAGFWFG